MNGGATHALGGGKFSTANPKVNDEKVSSSFHAVASTADACFSMLKNVYFEH